MAKGQQIMQAEGSAPGAVPGLVSAAAPGERQQYDPAVPAQALTAALDERALKDIRAMERNGARDLLRRLVAAYVHSSATLMQSAAEAFGRGDADGVARALHSLKSSSASLGALDFAQACARIESLARQSSLAPAEPLWVSLRTAFPGVIAALHALVAQEQAVAPHPAPAGR